MTYQMPNTPLQPSSKLQEDKLKAAQIELGHQHCLCIHLSNIEVEEPSSALFIACKATTTTTTLDSHIYLGSGLPMKSKWAIGIVSFVRIWNWDSEMP